MGPFQPTGAFQQDLAPQPGAVPHESATIGPDRWGGKRTSLPVKPRPPAHPVTRDQKRSLFLHAAIAEELKNRPIEVVEIARRNISRMRSRNPGAWKLLDEWEQIVEGTTDEIVARMLDPSDRGQNLRQVTPFAGVLTPTQRFDVYRSFANRE